MSENTPGAEIPNAPSLQFLRTTFAAELGAARAVECDVPHIITRHGEKLTNLESMMHLRQRFTGAYRTTSIPAFGLYVKRFAAKEDDVAAFVDPKAMDCTAYLNIGNKAAAGRCDHSAKVTLEKTAFWKALLEFVGKKHPQKEVAEFIEDWNTYFRAFSPSEVIRQASPDNPYPDYTFGGLPNAVKAIRHIEIKAGAVNTSNVGPLGYEKTSLEQVEASSKFTLPDMLVVHCNPYWDLPPVTIGLRLSVVLDDPPKIVLRIVQYEALVEKLGDDLVLAIENELSGELKVIKGIFTP